MNYNIDHEQSWNWQGEDYCFQKDFNLVEDIPNSLWNDVTLNEEDISYMLNETTPVKACVDLGAYNNSYEGNGSKEPEECRETYSQAKRRRMLQFDNQAVDSTLICEESSSAFLKSSVSATELMFSLEDSLIDVLPEEASQWISTGSENASGSSYGLDQSSEDWLTECLNDTALQFSPDELNITGAAASEDVQSDTSEVCIIPPVTAVKRVPRRPTRSSGNVVFKGCKSFIRTPTKLATSVAYPFAFIKPCGAHGDVTLNDINQRIRTPPPSKSKQIEDDPSAYPTSAFSGKPVIGKTKIQIEGGKGSITIMRTKG